MAPHRLGAILRSPVARAAAVAAVLAAWAWFLQGQVGALRAYEWRLAPGAFAAAVICGAAYFVGLAVSWTLLLRSMGRPAAAVPLAAGARVWTNTMLSRYLPGNIWHIVGRVAFAGRLGVAPAQVVASATVEQLLTLMGALAVFGLSLPFWGAGPDARAWLLLLVPAGLALLHPRAFGAAIDAVARALRRPELRWPYAYGEMVLVAAVATAANLVAGLALLVVVAAMAPVDGPQAAFVVGAAGLAWAVGYLSLLTPSGLGVREAALAALLVQVFPLPVAVVGSLVFRLALTLGEILAAGATILYGRLRPPPEP
jgi:hypothetical protein